MQFWAPQAKRALAACLLDLSVDQEARAPNDGVAALLTVSVEAVCAGTHIVPALQVDPDMHVGALKALIEGRCVPVSAWGIRLLAGQGGAELIDDQMSVRAAGVADGATLVVVQKPRPPGKVRRSLRMRVACNTFRDSW